MTYKGGTKKISRRRNSYITSSELAEERTTAYEIGLDYTVYKEIDIKAAINGLLEDKYETDFSSEPFSAFKTHATRKVRSAGGLNGQLVMPWPVIVRLTHWVDSPRPEPVHWSDKATRRQIMHRDGWTCGYCLAPARTVDHKKPESRGGLWTWENLIAACASCNQKKDDQTPEEAGMVPLWDTYARQKYVGVQSEVWRILKES